MKFARSLGMAAGLIVLATPFVTMADPPASAVDQRLLQQMYPNSGNNAAQGRFYNDNDYWLDPHSGLPVPGAPTVKDYGGE
jgi:hypothetical protein